MRAVFTLLLLCPILGAAQATCPAYNTGTKGPFLHTLSDTTQHVTGEHSSAMSASGSCTYTGGQVPCGVEAVAESVTPSPLEDGELTVSGYHVAGKAVAGGVATAGNGNSATADTESALAFQNCLTQGCNVNVSITGSGQGVGFTVNFPPNRIWEDKWYYKNNCPGMDASANGGGGSCYGPNRSAGPDGGCQTPLIFDTKRLGFKDGLSDPRECVMFDIVGNGKLQCLSWPKIGSGLGWLVLPDAMGRVTIGKQLFGNNTPQPNHPNPRPNGFLALAEWDMPTNGGNLDTMIDAKDAVWSRLRIWVDEHCQIHRDEPCTALPGELHKLSEYEITSISLIYESDHFVDKWGDTFKLFTRINVQPEKLQDSTDPRRMYDVWLVERR